jgi:hypothetical protein
LTSCTCHGECSFEENWNTASNIYIPPPPTNPFAPGDSMSLIKAASNTLMTAPLLFKKFQQIIKRTEAIRKQWNIDTGCITDLETNTRNKRKTANFS